MPPPLTLNALPVPEVLITIIRILSAQSVALVTVLALAMCLFQGSEREAARKVYERVLEIEPENAIAKNNLAALTVGEPMASRDLPVAVTPRLEDLVQHLQRAGLGLEHLRRIFALGGLEQL